MDDVVQHIHGRAEPFEGLFDAFNGPFNSRAKPPRSRKNNLHVWCLSKYKWEENVAKNKL
jgi:hypothetical protein